jgi:valyl-tRNA synthetase
VRYWAASTGLGKDAVISEQKIGLGAKLVNKLWNVARFSQRFLAEGAPAAGEAIPALSVADRWVLSRAQQVIRKVTQHMRGYDHAAAKSEIEVFFWTEFADNYLEMAKLRLYGTPLGLPPDSAVAGAGARFALYHVLLTVVKLFAPFLPHVTERIYGALFASPNQPSIHTAPWPEPDPGLEDEEAERTGATLVGIGTAVRRYKSEHSLSLGSPLQVLELSTDDPDLCAALFEARADIASITRAGRVSICDELSTGQTRLPAAGPVALSVLS